MIAGGNVTAYVADLGRAIRFYVETLGMKLVMESPGWALVDAGDGLLIGLHPRPSGVASAGANANDSIASLSIGLRVKASLEDAVAVFENRGITFDVKKDAFVKLAFFTDPDRNPLYLFEEPKR